jgi:hypothetical protein
MELAQIIDHDPLAHLGVGGADVELVVGDTHLGDLDLGLEQRAPGEERRADHDQQGSVHDVPHGM